MPKSVRILPAQIARYKVGAEFRLRSIWHNEEKAQEARRWLRTQERRPYVMGAAIGALATLAAAIVVALIGVWFE